MFLCSVVMAALWHQFLEIILNHRPGHFWPLLLDAADVTNVVAESCLSPAICLVFPLPEGLVEMAPGAQVQPWEWGRHVGNQGLGPRSVRRGLLPKAKCGVSVGQPTCLETSDYLLGLFFSGHIQLCLVLLLTLCQGSNHGQLRARQTCYLLFIALALVSGFGG